MEIILEITGVNKITPPSERFLSVIMTFYHRSGRKARFPNDYSNLSNAIFITATEYNPSLLFMIWQQVESWDMSWLDDLPKCPPCLPKINNEFISPDPSIWDKPHTPFLSFIFHPGGKWEIRTKHANSKGAGNQCIYDENGKRIDTFPTHGTADRAQATGDNLISTIKLNRNHQLNDVAPFILALALDKGNPGMHVRLYTKVRPHWAE